MDKNTRNDDVGIKMKRKRNMELENNYAGNLNGARLIIYNNNLEVSG